MPNRQMLQNAAMVANRQVALAMNRSALVAHARVGAAYSALASRYGAMTQPNYGLLAQRADNQLAAAAMNPGVLPAQTARRATAYDRPATRSDSLEYRDGYRAGAVIGAAVVRTGVTQPYAIPQGASDAWARGCRDGVLSTGAIIGLCGWGSSAGACVNPPAPIPVASYDSRSATALRR